jgi:ribose 5-phosphate isomerase A
VEKTTKGKEAAALAAAELIQEGMIVGLGTGSTVAFFLKRLGERCRQGLTIKAAASSIRTEKIAQELGIPVIELKGLLDIVVDGADEVDHRKRLIKGGGGALLREKMLAFHSRQMVVIVDEEKLVTRLGKALLPIEIVSFGHEATRKSILEQRISVMLRLNRENVPYVTDNGNYILDADISNYNDQLEELDIQLRQIPGVVETGLFLGLANKIIVGHEDGSTQEFV